MKPIKNENAAQAAPAPTQEAANPDRGMLAKVREQLIAADLEDVTRPNQLLVRGIVGKATVAVGYANPDIRELTVMREFRFAPMKPGTDAEKPGLFRAWEDLIECPRPFTEKLGHTVWLFAVNPASIQCPIGVDLKLPEIAENPNLGTREHPLHGTTADLVQLPREKWTKKLRDNSDIRRVFKLNRWIPLERQADTNWLTALVEFTGGIPSDFDSKHDRLQVTVTCRPSALGWLSREDAAAACEAARFNRTAVVKNKITAALPPQQNSSKELENMM